MKRKCNICHKEFAEKDLTSADLLNDFIVNLIKASHPDWADHSFICNSDLNHFRSLYVREALKQDIGELTQLELDVLESIRQHELLSDNLNTQFDANLTFGDRLSDKIAAIGGSWKFIIFFVLILIFWIFLNVVIISTRPFDPYPFILLNLVLSCLAALQAPIIMMSQNRQEAKDRLRAEMDYKVNLKAELEIRHLKAKLDQLASHQWRRLLEIQELQTELMEDLARSKVK